MLFLWFFLCFFYGYIFVISSLYNIKSSRSIGDKQPSELNFIICSSFLGKAISNCLEKGERDTVNFLYFGIDVISLSFGTSLSISDWLSNCNSKFSDLIDLILSSGYDRLFTLDFDESVLISSKSLNANIDPTNSYVFLVVGGFSTSSKYILTFWDETFLIFFIIGESALSLELLSSKSHSTFDFFYF